MYSTQIISKKSSFPLQNNSVAIRSLKIGTWGMDFEWRRLICTSMKFGIEVCNLQPSPVNVGAQCNPQNIAF